jgi:hypothetical protein
MTKADTGAEVQTGGWHVRQGGQIVASGSGPLDAVRREAAHYAAVYRQDGPVTVRVWTHKRREVVR